MILEALNRAGGVDYLLRQSEESKTAFLALLGRVLPMQLNATLEHRYVARTPAVPSTTEEWKRQHTPQQPTLQ
jgi:hypothetical protein